MSLLNHYRRFRILWKLADNPFDFPQVDKFTKTPLWQCAREAVADVIGNHALQYIAAIEEKTSFCPRCGQLTDGDRRFEEAREFVLTRMPDARRNDVDFAISAQYWARRREIP